MYNEAPPPQIYSLHPKSYSSGKLFHNFESPTLLNEGLELQPRPGCITLTCNKLNYHVQMPLQFRITSLIALHLAQGYLDMCVE